MPNDTTFLPKYNNSHALIIGVDKYSKVSPLGYACSDARAVAEYLVSHMEFPAGNVTLLLDSEATRDAIMRAYLGYGDGAIAADDRLLVFFAGHGYTRTARRGEIGFLVPVDGDPADLSTLIRWDDLTRNAELIRAKHVLFIMDACYGGLAVTRAIGVGTLRFLKDMLQRYSRQVLTAGKADEAVADAGGPRPGHSIFTGHLLDALEGAAASADGVLTANGVMSYVYERVSKDSHSSQSPHFGFLDGDGDFVFRAPQLQDLLKAENVDDDVLVQPVAFDSETESIEGENFPDAVKELLSEQRLRIRLDDLATRELRNFLALTSLENFPTAGTSAEEVAERLRRYERVAHRVGTLALLLARWANPDQRSILTRLAVRSAENIELTGGNTLWIGLRWYPVEYILYAAGIAAISAERYDNLSAMFEAPISLAHEPDEQPLLWATERGFLDATRADAFKRVPGHERHYAPRSEYMFKTMQPLLEDLLFLGRNYEPLFDRYEVLVALSCVDISFNRGSSRAWGPPGRFAWKANRGIGKDPLTRIVEEAQRAGQHWLPLTAGMFGGSLERFNKAANQYFEFVKQLGWV